MASDIQVHKTGQSQWDVECLVPLPDGETRTQKLGTFYDKSIVDIFVESLRSLHNPSGFTSPRPVAPPQAA